MQPFFCSQAGACDLHPSCCSIWMRYGLNTKHFTQNPPHLRHHYFLRCSSRFLRNMQKAGLNPFNVLRATTWFLLAQTHSFSKLFIPHRRVLCVLCTKCTLHSNHTRVIFQHKILFPPERPIFSLHKLASPSGRNVNYDEKHLTGVEQNWVVPFIFTCFVSTCPTVFL